MIFYKILQFLHKNTWVIKKTVLLYNLSLTIDYHVHLLSEVFSTFTSFKTRSLMHNWFLILVLSCLMACNSQKETPKTHVPSKSESTKSTLPKSIVSIYLVEEIMTDDGKMAAVSDLDMVIELQSQDIIMGFSGCNQFHGKYSYNDGSFEASEISITFKMCEDNMDIEKALLDYLQTDLEVENTDRGITLSKEDTIVMKLKKIDE